MDSMIQGFDVYLRIGQGPIQQFRAWDRGRFIASQINQGLEAKDGPVIVTVCTGAEYREQWAKGRK